LKKSIYILLIVIVGLSQQSCLRYHLGFSKQEKTIDKINVFPINFEKGLYKTNIRFLRKDYSGLMFFKKSSDKKETRMVFMSEFGLKFFDFKLKDNGDFTVEYIIDELNKKGLISVLEQDMKLLFPNLINSDVKHYKTKKENILVDKFNDGKYRYYYFFNKGNNTVSSIEYSSRIFNNIKIEIKDYKEKTPSLIDIKHVNISLKLHLKLIK